MPILRFPFLYFISQRYVSGGKGADESASPGLEVWVTAKVFTLIYLAHPSYLLKVVFLLKYFCCHLLQKDITVSALLKQF